MRNLLNQALIARTRAASAAEIIQPVQIGNPVFQNELVFFIKPELLSVEAVSYTHLDVYKRQDPGEQHQPYRRHSQHTLQQVCTLER